MFQVKLNLSDKSSELNNLKNYFLGLFLCFNVKHVCLINIFLTVFLELKELKLISLLQFLHEPFTFHFLCYLVVRILNIF